MKSIQKALCAAAILLNTGCVAMRENGNISVRQVASSKPSVYLTADYTSLKNGERRAYMNEYCRKDTLKKATVMLEETGLFGEITTDFTKGPF